MSARSAVIPFPIKRPAAYWPRRNIHSPPRPVRCMSIHTASANGDRRLRCTYAPQATHILAHPPPTDFSVADFPAQHRPHRLYPS
ncbi:hypothetical protein HYPSUDRAFT_1026271 [Hypholoma sublateritium FD-334 SS-4]|uniref:Uncharacterized protein n=1 Tax=Hypholoma sublateritium (strain FD-334 SS-4) TaxID=945553 RepID=A0A0D2NL26_HYPSF|nr:hypothetical protein HYPSUDRAFT_1026271 [Hypholoma sublateritium FD-334 SS-4]